MTSYGTYNKMKKGKKIMKKKAFIAMFICMALIVSMALSVGATYTEVDVFTDGWMNGNYERCYPHGYLYIDETLTSITMMARTYIQNQNNDGTTVQLHMYAQCVITYSDGTFDVNSGSHISPVLIPGAYNYIDMPQPVDMSKTFVRCDCEHALGYPASNDSIWEGATSYVYSGVNA